MDKHIHTEEQLLIGPQEKFCINCGALLVNTHECTDCAPYQRIIEDCNAQIEMLRERSLDAFNNLARVSAMRRNSFKKATQIN